MEFTIANSSVLIEGRTGKGEN